MKTKAVTFVVVLLCGFSMRAAGQDMTTMGTDFWFSFAEGRIEAEMSVTVTGTRACSGVLTNPNTGWTRTFNVPAGGSVTVVIDTLQAYNIVPGIVRNKGLHLTTTDEVSVYASNFLRTSFDATFVLPTDALGDEYMVQTFESCHTGDPSEFLIVGVEDNTVVDIFLPSSGGAMTVT
ncbi:MAG: IgGFc-binding protein, partial [Bacteroidales bacterium]|nr:IgGFc-binding protein [Bacteroidales bacterium]